MISPLCWPNSNEDFFVWLPLPQAADFSSVSLKKSGIPPKKGKKQIFSLFRLEILKFRVKFIPIVFELKLSIRKRVFHGKPQKKTSHKNSSA